LQIESSAFWKVSIWILWTLSTLPKISGRKKLCTIDVKPIDARILAWAFRMINARDFAVKWRVIDVMDLVDDYLGLMPDPHLLIEVKSKNEELSVWDLGWLH
jgi:hypothetical protein